MTVSKFLQLIESTSESQLVRDRYLFRDLLFSFPFKRNNYQVQLQLTSDYFLSSSKPLKAITNQSTENTEILNLEPLEPVVSILKDNIYRIENIYRKYNILLIIPGQLLTYLCFISYNSLFFCLF